MSDDADDHEGASRRELLGGLGLAGLFAAIPGAADARPHHHHHPEPHHTAFDAALQANVQTVVVIYAENRSFNNLFGNFPGVQSPLKDVPAERYQQRDRDGSVLKTLPPIWKGMVPESQVVNHTTYQINEADTPSLANAPFALKTPAGDPLPQGLVTRDLIHAFYHNQMQINGGKNDRFVAWGDSGGLVMGHYGNNHVNLRLWRVAQDYTLCDNFFMGAFGCSFLNHQYLVAATAPHFPDADKSPAHVQIAQVEGDDPKGSTLRRLPDTPASAMDGPPKFAVNALSPDFYAVNTMTPPYAPTTRPDKANPLFADTSYSRALPPQSHATIGDRLSDKGVKWAWYAGGWDWALKRTVDAPESADFPLRPNFQDHHQPFNYFKRFAPGTNDRAEHLRDGGLDDTSRTNRFLADAEAGTLPPVTFYKPQGNLNMHAGTSDVDSGDRHITSIINTLQRAPQWKNMVVIITFDENGGWWDHVAPPKGDRWGPGMRVPAIIVSPFARKGHVDHTVYDTGSIARFITRRFGLETLPGLKEREQAMIAAGGPPPGDLTNALAFS